jgi:hypothetical protein
MFGEGSLLSELVPDIGLTLIAEMGLISFLEGAVDGLRLEVLLFSFKELLLI